jgi:signal transduction histidine kinase
MSSARLEQPRLLPAMLVPPPGGADSAGGRAGRSTRDWIVDVAFFLIALLVGWAGLRTEAARAHGSDGMQAAAFVCGLLAVGLLWWRRRWPVVVAVGCTLLATYSTFAAPAELLALLTVAVHRRFAVVAVVTAFSFATTPVNLVLHPGTSDPWATSLLLSVVFSALVIAGGMFVRARRQLVLSLRERADRAESEQQLRVEQARHHERAQIAREMHDVLAHRISLLSMHAGALEFRPDAPPGEIERAAGVVRASAHQALEDLREVIGVLREDEADGGGPERPQPALENLPALLDESRTAGMHVSSECRVEDLTTVPAGVGRNAYRIVQEGLTNARKHAHGAAVDVTLEGAPGEGLTVEVRNRLPLTDAATAQIPGTGTGLIGLAERTSLAGGRLDHGRTPDGDFRLRAWLPWPA